jgi:lipopolysaccharide transport system ATP-binding protein
MTNTAIKVENMRKRYRIGAREAIWGSLHDAVRQWLRASWRRRSEEHIWALDDVSFEIKQGEVVGIIGRNGSGKSTLFKILARITEPTSGRAELHGRVGSLLEVGTGFHPELTGRENIYLNGAILGMKKWEIDHRFDEIVAFSEIEKFLDTPVKHYSSGMYVRLAFAVAAHLEPEILLVDEVLAVGDVAFQKKCLGKMDEVAAQGRTVLFVSHNMQAIEHLCRSALVLRDGQLVYQGAVEDAIALYLKSRIGDERAGYADLRAHPGRLAGMQRLLTGIGLRDPAVPGGYRNVVSTGEDLEFEITFDCGDQVLDYAALGISALSGERVITVGTHLCPTFAATFTGQGSLRCTIPHVHLAGGTYNVFIAIGNRYMKQNLDYVVDAMQLHVHYDGYYGLDGALMPGEGHMAQRSGWQVADDPPSREK